MIRFWAQLLISLPAITLTFNQRFWTQPHFKETIIRLQEKVCKMPKISCRAGGWANTSLWWVHKFYEFKTMAHHGTLGPEVRAPGDGTLLASDQLCRPKPCIGECGCPLTVTDRLWRGACCEAYSLVPRRHSSLLLGSSRIILKICPKMTISQLPVCSTSPGSLQWR